MFDDQPHLKRLNLNLVYALDAILRSPTLTRAGQSIRLSQPTMSQALRRLREHFDDELVVYGNGTRRLTALAEALLPRVRQVLHQANDLFTLDMDFDPARARRTITLAASEPVEIAFLTPLAPELLQEGAGLTLDVMPLGNASGASLFEAGVDMAIVPQSMLRPDCRHIPLFTQEPQCLVWENHPTIGDEVTARDYATGRHAAVGPDLERDAAFPGFGHPLIEDRRIVVRTRRFSALPMLIVGTDLIVTTTAWYAQYMAYLHPLKAVLSPFTDSTTLYAQWEAYRDREPLIEWLRDRLSRAARRRWADPSAHRGNQ